MTKIDMYCIAGVMIFLSLGFISLVGMCGNLDINHVWHIIFGLLCINGIAIVMFGAGGNDSVNTYKENKELGRHWVWDKFDVCDPDLCEGHYEYDTI